MPSIAERLEEVLKYDPESDLAAMVRRGLEPVGDDEGGEVGPGEDEVVNGGQVEELPGIDEEVSDDGILQEDSGVGFEVHAEVGAGKVVDDGLDGVAAVAVMQSVQENRDGQIRVTLEDLHGGRKIPAGLWCQPFEITDDGLEVSGIVNLNPEYQADYTVFVEGGDGGNEWLVHRSAHGLREYCEQRYGAEYDPKTGVIWTPEGEIGRMYGRGKTHLAQMGEVLDSWLDVSGGDEAGAGLLVTEKRVTDNEEILVGRTKTVTEAQREILAKNGWLVMSQEQLAYIVRADSLGRYLSQVHAARVDLVNRRVICERDNVGWLVGRNGMHVKDIATALGVDYLKVVNASEAGEEELVEMVEWKLNEVAEAMEESYGRVCVDAGGRTYLVRKSRESFEAYLRQRFEGVELVKNKNGLVIVCDEEDVGKLIGSRGAHVKMLQEQMGVKLEIRVKRDGIESATGEGLVRLVQGQFEEAEKQRTRSQGEFWVRDGNKTWVVQKTKRGIEAYVQQRFGAKVDFEAGRVYVSDSEKGGVIGRRGAHIQRLMRMISDEGELRVVHEIVARVGEEKQEGSEKDIYVVEGELEPHEGRMLDDEGYIYFIGLNGQNKTYVVKRTLAGLSAYLLDRYGAKLDAESGYVDVEDADTRARLEKYQVISELQSRFGTDVLDKLKLSLV